MSNYQSELYDIVEKSKKYDELLKFKGWGELRCSFCFKSQNEIEHLIMGTGVFICNECVGLCNEILDEKKEEIKEDKSE